MKKENVGSVKRADRVAALSGHLLPGVSGEGTRAGQAGETSAEP